MTCMDGAIDQLQNQSIVLFVESCMVTLFVELCQLEKAGFLKRGRAESSLSAKLYNNEIISEGRD